jgi:hypothetical protein
LTGHALIKTGTDIGKLLYGACTYWIRGQPSHVAWQSLLNLHCRTNGRSSDRVATILRQLRPPRTLSPATGIVGTLSVGRQQSIAQELARNGYYLFDQLAPAEFCDEIERFTRLTPAVIEGRGSTPDERVTFDETNPLSKTYRFAIDDVTRNAALQRLMADKSLLAVAEAYLAAQPILSGINVWWSPSFGATPGSDAAQLFHFDFDGAPIWLKFFIYITDVGRENGPHVFVRGSHLAGHPAAAAFLPRGYVRITYDEIAAAFGKENVIEFCGKRGTVLAVDTRGFHKGKMPVSGSRLIAQLMYCCPEFNWDAPRQSLPAKIDPALSRAIMDSPHVFERFPYRE